MADKSVYVKEGRWSAERKDQAEGGMQWGGLPATAGWRFPTAPLSVAGSDPQGRHWWRWDGIAPPHAWDTSLCESIFSSQPESLLPHPSWCGGEAWSPAYSGSTHAKGGEAVASEELQAGDSGSCG